MSECKFCGSKNLTPDITEEPDNIRLLWCRDCGACWRHDAIEPPPRRPKPEPADSTFESLTLIVAAR